MQSYRHFVQRNACPGCRSSALALVFRAPLGTGELFDFLCRYYRRPREQVAEWLDGAEYVLDACQQCSLVFQRHVPNDSFMSELYGRWLGSGDSQTVETVLRDALTTPYATRDAHELFAAAAFLGKPLKELRVFDYGMGLGLWANIAKALGCQVYGFDLSASRQRLARERGIEVVAPEDVSGLNFDFVNTDQVLEHVAAPLPLLEHLASALAPRGILKVSVPRVWALTARLQLGRWDATASSPYSLRAVHPLEHVNAWSDRSLRTVAQTAGLMPVEVPLCSSLAFIAQRGSFAVTRPRALLKALLRPAYNRHSATNLYRWFTR